MDPFDSTAFMAAQNYAEATKGLGKSADEFAKSIAEVFVKTKQYISNPPQPEPPVTEPKPSQEEQLSPEQSDASN